MRKRVYEAFPESPLSRMCREIVVRGLGVLPFPYGDDSIMLKATYFNFNPDTMDIATGEDVKITVTDDSITLFVNRDCSPSGGWFRVLVEPITEEKSFALALADVVEAVKEVTQKHGAEWCRIGNYKTLEIKSPYLDRLMAFCIQNPDLNVPVVASKLLKDMKPTPEVDRTLSVLRGEVLPDEKVNKINREMQDGVKPIIIRDVKPMSDRQKKNQLNKLVSLGIGGGNKPKPSNPRIRKLR